MLQGKGSLKKKTGSKKPFRFIFVLTGLLVLAIVACGLLNRHPGLPAAPLNITSTHPTRRVEILVDDFKPQPYQGESTYFYNRLEGDRGAINGSVLAWGDGQVTTTIAAEKSWGGVWMSLNHPIREGQSINFSAILPAQVVVAYQSQINGLTVQIASGSPGKTFRLELKDGDSLRWKKETTLQGGQQAINVGLPPLGNINQLVWILDGASPGDAVVIQRVSFTATTQITDTATTAFVWSYGMLLNNWNPTSGLVRDKAKDASGEFDAIQATGSLAAATAVAEQLGVIKHDDAVQIVEKIGTTLLLLPELHGLWPHWVKTSPAEGISIVKDTEWSSVDTVIAALGLLEAQSGLGLDTSGVEHKLQGIEWNNLVAAGGISHGYTYSGALIPYTWDVFGGESWLVELAYAGAAGQIAPLTYSTPPTANGSGFIDELVWLFVPPPAGQDHWGTDWAAYRAAAVYRQVKYYSTQAPVACFTRSGLFGLSAAKCQPLPGFPREASTRRLAWAGSSRRQTMGRHY